MNPTPTEQSAAPATLQPAHEIARYVQKLENCAVCGDRSPELACPGCLADRPAEVRERVTAGAQAAEAEYRARIDTCKACLSQASDEIYCENVPCPEYVPRKKAIAGKRRADGRAEQAHIIV